MSEWKTGFCSCCSNCKNCLCVYCLPCIPHGQAWEKMGSSCIGCGAIFCIPIANLVALTMLRGKVREQHHIEGGVFGDFLASWCCPCCTLIQVANELDDTIQRS